MKALSIFVSILFCVSAHAANVRLYFQSNTNAATFDTNYLVATPISSNILASGGVKPIGLPFRIANPSGVVTQSFNLGWYSISNGILGKGVVINIWDSSSALYDLTNVIRSGFNTYAVTVYGTNPPPTFDEITNAVSGYYAPSNGLFTASNFLFSISSTATNTGITAATATNISANQSLIVSNGLSSRLLATNTLNLASVVTNTGGFATNLTVKAVGPSSTKAVSVYGIDGNEYFYVTDESAFLPNITSSSDAVLIGVNSEGRIVKALNNTFTNNTVVNAINATNIYGAGLTTITNAAVTVAGNATNNLAIVITNRYNAADTVVSNGLSDRLLATNTLLVQRITDATNTLKSAYVAADTVVSNGLSDRLLATNTLLVQRVTDSTNAYKVRAIAAGSGVTVTTNASDGLYTIAASSGAGGGIPTANGSGTNTTLYFSTAQWGTNNSITTKTKSATLSGEGNTMVGAGDGAVISGGLSNSINSGSFVTVSGGFANSSGLSAAGGAIGGGALNGIAPGAAYVTIPGGFNNTSGVGANYASILGGLANVAGSYSTVAGGLSNNISGVNSFGAGWGANSIYNGTFVWSDNSGTNFSASGHGQFLVRSYGGAAINTNNPSGNALRVIGQTATDNLAIGNRAVFQLTTNVIAVTNAGTASANGTYRVVNSSHYTNDFTGSVITNNTAGNWQIKNGTTVLYSSTTPAGSTWTVQSGSSPAAISLFGSYLQSDGIVIRGVISSTNLDQRLISANISGTLTNNTTGYAAGATNLLAPLFGLLNTNRWLATNYTYDKEYIYVTGADSALVNGTYRRHWYDDSTKRGVWTNTASTNLIFQNDGGGNISGIPFVIEGRTNSTSYLYSDILTPGLPGLDGLHDYWINPFVAEGAEFSGSATLTWATNRSADVFFTLTPTNNILLSSAPTTNLLRVELWGSDVIADRTNGIPFKTLWWAVSNSAWGDTIKVGPGYHESYSFYMKRGTHIEGSGPGTVINMKAENDINSIYRFQSRLISLQDQCTIGNLVLSNGAIGMTQSTGFYGGTNQYAYNIDIYPHRVKEWNDDQGTYFGVGVRVSRLADNALLRNIRVFSPVLGFVFDEPEVNTTTHTNNQITLIDCEAYCDPKYAGGDSNLWNTAGSYGNYVGIDEPGVGGMIPLGFASKLFPPTYSVPPFTVNIVGGIFSSINGGTNVTAVYGSATNTSRNAAIYISSAYTNELRINLIGNPQFIYGSTNAAAYFILNETTNNNVKLSGQALVKEATRGIPNLAGTNRIVSFSQQVGDGGGLTNLLTYQTVYASGTAALSSGSQATMNFGTTDPVLTVSADGVYQIMSRASGYTASADSGFPVTIVVTSNSVNLANSDTTIAAVDSGLAGMTMTWSTTTPTVYTPLRSGDSIALQWISGDTSWAADQASISIVRVK